MTGRDEQERSAELARLWQSSVAPVEDETNTATRGARIVPRLGDAILRASARRRRERSVRRFGIVLAVAACLALAFGLGHRAERTPEVAKAARSTTSGVRAMSGAVTLVRGSQARSVESSAIETGDSLSTGPDATAELRLTDLVVASIGSSSELSLVTPRASSHRLRLDRGELHAKVNNRPSATPKLIVETPNVEVVVTGTIFDVDVTEGDGAKEATTLVRVAKGRIVIRRNGAEVAAVTAGQSWNSAAVPLASTPAPSASAAVIPKATTPSSQKEAAASRHATSEAVTATVTSAGASTAEDWGNALVEENRLFRTAIAAKSRGDDYEAITRLTELLDRYPAAPLAAEARVERMRALQRTGHVMEAAREAKLYLAEYPRGFAREEARALVERVEAN